MTRIDGTPHYYLVLWAWATTAVAISAIGATAARGRRHPPRPARHGATAGPVTVPHRCRDRLPGRGAARLGRAGHVELGAMPTRVGRSTRRCSASWPRPHRRVRDGRGAGRRRRTPTRSAPTTRTCSGSRAYGMFHELRRGGIDARLPTVPGQPAGGHEVREGERSRSSWSPSARGSPRPGRTPKRSRWRRRIPAHPPSGASRRRIARRPGRLRAMGGRGRREGRGEPDGAGPRRRPARRPRGRPRRRSPRFGAPAAVFVLPPSWTP